MLFPVGMEIDGETAFRKSLFEARMVYDIHELQHR